MKHERRELKRTPHRATSAEHESQGNEEDDS
jgi:hypothetical protein